MKFRVDIHAYGETRWASNSVEFDSKEAGLDWAHDRSLRWVLVHAYRVVPTSVPRGEVYHEKDADKVW